MLDDSEKGKSKMVIRFANQAEFSSRDAVAVGEASVAAGVPPRGIVQLIDDGAFPDSACLIFDAEPALRAFAVPALGFAASEVAKRLDKGTWRRAVCRIGEFVEKDWMRLRKEPKYAMHIRVEMGEGTVNPGRAVFEAMVGLNRWIEARSRIVENPNIRGGMLTIRGTRVGVYEAAEFLAGEGMEAALEHYPSMNREGFEAAAMYAKAHPRPTRPRGSGPPRARIRTHPLIAAEAGLSASPGMVRDERT